MDDVFGYEGLYQINRQGEIWSCSHRKMMKPQLNKGYLYVNLRKEGKTHKGSIHRLIALQYIPNPETKTEVDHIDRNRSNNDLSNLRWTTHRENMNNIEEGKGFVCLDKSTTARRGHDYYKAEYSITVDGLRVMKRANHRNKALLEEWVRTKGGVEIPITVRKGLQREAKGWINTHKGSYRAGFRNKRKQSKDRAICEAWLEEQKLAEIRT